MTARRPRTPTPRPRAGTSSRRGVVVWLALPAAALATLVAAGCTDTEQVFVEVPAFTDPPTAAQGFLGYTDQSSRRPVCGNCHIGQSAEWTETAHAHAWETLQASGSAQTFCEGCHTVNERGNLVEAERVGWTGTSDPRYHDVQCESCHGPGLDHITNPDASQPYASLLVGSDLTSGCGECHQGAHHPFVDEWAVSGHGDMNPFPQGRADCVQCHEARGIFAAWGIRSDYIEKEQSEAIPITCAVCHDPHDATNPNQLRFPIDVPNEDVNLCMKCHHKRGVPDPTTFRGPHSPQGPLLLGDAGWRPPNFEFPVARILGTHGSEANPRLCAGCHVNRYEVTDPATGDFVFNASGHLFQAIPCLDAEGIPTTADDCTLQERSFQSCSTSGCHGSQDAARSALVVARDRIAEQAAELRALLAQIPSSEFVVDDRYTTAEGSRFNAELAEIPGSAIHNPFLVEALIRASKRQIERDYGITAPGRSAYVHDTGGTR